MIYFIFLCFVFVCFLFVSRPELPLGKEVIRMLENLIFNERKQPNFFLLYELFAGHATLQITSHDSAYDVGAFLFAISGTDAVSGVQYGILKVMYTHPSLAAKMPAFEDKRRLKLPTFTGLDVYQAHIKAVAAFAKENISAMNTQLLAADKSPVFKSPKSIAISPTLVSSENVKDGRCWLNPQIMEYTATERVVSIGSIPAALPTLGAYFSREMSFLMAVPLHSIDLRTFIEQRTYEQQQRSGQQSLLAADGAIAKLPVNILEHPSSQSFIARLSVSRLEADYASFQVDEKAGFTPVLKTLNNTSTLDLPGVQAAGTSIKGSVILLYFP